MCSIDVCDTLLKYWKVSSMEDYIKIPDINKLFIDINIIISSYEDIKSSENIFRDYCNYINENTECFKSIDGIHIIEGIIVVNENIFNFWYIDSGVDNNHVECYIEINYKYFPMFIFNNNTLVQNYFLELYNMELSYGICNKIIEYMEEEYIIREREDEYTGIFYNNLFRNYNEDKYLDIMDNYRSNIKSNNIVGVINFYSDKYEQVSPKILYSLYNR